MGNQHDANETSRAICELCQVQVTSALNQMADEVDGINYLGAMMALCVGLLHAQAGKEFTEGFLDSAKRSLDKDAPFGLARHGAVH